MTAVTAGDFGEHNTKLTVASDEKANGLWLEPDDIFVERANTAELVGTAALYRGPRDYAIFPDLLIRVRLVRDLPPAFIAAFLKSTRARSYFQEKAQGIAGSMPKVSQGTVESLGVPVPPVAEQRRVIEAIDSYFTRLDDAVATLERVQAKLKAYRASVLKAAVEGRLVPTEADLARAEKRDYEPAEALLKRILAERRRRWEEAELAKLKAKGKAPKNDKWKAKYKEPLAPDTSGLPELPEGWCWATLDQLTSLITSGSRGWAKYYSDSGAVFVRAQDIKTDAVVIDDIAHVAPPQGAEGSRTSVQQLDLLVTITGANVTKTALLEQDLGEAYVSQHVGLCRPVAPDTSRYLHRYIICPSAGRRYLEKAAYGAGKPGLNLDNLREMQVALPPLAEQERVVGAADDLLSVAAHAETALKRDLKRCARLRQAVLKWAFEGKLVDQDPEDEPAEKLLERIRAEREAAAPEKKTKKKTTRKKKKAASA